MISYRRTIQGAWELSAFVADSLGDYLLTRQYFGYNKKEATNLFRQTMKEATNAR